MTRHVRTHRIGEWLPSDQKLVDAWLAHLIDETTRSPQDLHPVIREFQALIEREGDVYMLFHQMFDQLPKRPRFFADPGGAPQVRDYQHMLQLLNAVITKAPEFNKSGSVGLPINTILEWPMGTPSGTAAFLHPKVNVALRKILNEWARFLGSTDSRYVLNDEPNTGWFGKEAMAAMPDFDAMYVCEPSAPYRGFKSWDDFFTRQFRPGARPLAAPQDDAVVINACESAPYRVARDVRSHDRFWIKGQPYSLTHMLAADPATPQFVGGTVYQAYLNSLSYHRWHSPVSGIVVKTCLIPGTYYAQAQCEGLDPHGVHDSQGYLTEVATRGLIFIEADNPAIGLMCFMPIGMAEVSTCDIRVYEGQHVAKGDPLGMFHYGGSTYCLIFRPGVKLTFNLHGQTPGVDSSNILVNAPIATVEN